MDVLIRYALPIAAALLICVFFLGLPLLSRCRLRGEKADRHMRKRDWLIVLAVTAVYAVFAFVNLGDCSAPVSFKEIGGGEQVILELQETADPDTLLCYTNINTGTYTVEASPDGENYHVLTVIEQGHADILKWLSFELGGAAENTGFIRISASGGSPRLGELLLYEDGKILNYSGCAELNDEAELAPAEPSYMNSSYFDEIYHARTAMEHIQGMNPYEISHPPLGKLIIALGILIFGSNPFGWRFMGTLFGVLMLPVMYVFAKKVFGGRAVPACCTIIFAADFMHFVQTRIATIDTYAVFFILLMYLFMYMWLTEDRLKYLALSGLFFGLGAASKWTSIYAGAGLAVIWGIHWILHGRKEGIKAFLKNCLWCLLFFVFIPCCIYYVSYYPYAAAQGMHGFGALFTRRYAETVISNQEFMFTYHCGVDATHPYSSRWYQWMLDIRPILYYLHYFDDGSRSSFGTFVNPALCWGGLLALFVLIYTAIFRRDKKAAFILIGYLAQLVPWMFVKRVTFEYHYFPCTVFLVLALGYVMELLRLSDRRWRHRVYGFTAMCCLLFVLFYPALSGMRVDNNLATSLLGWLPTWPF